MKQAPFKKNSIIFAPMEGVTDVTYREVICELYPEWDFYCTDFLRIPSAGIFPLKQFYHHVGEQVIQSAQMSKTIYQILVSNKSLIEEHMPMINHLNLRWLDLNLGCPSKTVCKNEGGSFLLSSPQMLRNVIRKIRKNFSGWFSAKIRVGFNDDSAFADNLRLLEDEGVDSITIHGRTRVELYKGFANWDYIKEAVKTVKIPIIGNGDIWTTDDIDRYFDYTNAHSIMIGRGALKTPWLTYLYQNNIPDTPQLRLEMIKQYYQKLYTSYYQKNNDEALCVKRLKAVSRYLYEPFSEPIQIKKSIMLSKSYEQIQNELTKINTSDNF